MTDILIVSYSYIAALIGAGFASGQEILLYFNKYGINGFYGLILSALIFTLFLFITLTLCRKNNISDLNEYLNFLCHLKTAKTIKYIIGIFSFAVYFVMIAAAGQILSSMINTTNSFSTFLIALICSIIFITKKDNIFNLNGILGLILTAGIISCCFYILRYREFHVFSEKINSITNSAIYTGYNLVSSIPILVSLSARLKKQSHVISVSIISGIVLMMMTLLIFSILSIYQGKINLGEFPMLTLANRQNYIFSKIYLSIFFCAIITTLFSSGISVIEAFKLHDKYKIFIMSSIAYSLSSFGFVNLINTAYRICGIIGFVVIMYLFIKNIRKI